MAALLCVAGAGTAQAAIPSGTPVRGSDLTPQKGAPAVPEDNRQHGGWTEWWYWHVVDPKTKLQYIGTLLSRPMAMVGGVLQYGPKRQPIALDPRAPIPGGFAQVMRPPNDGLPGARTNGAWLNYDTAKQAWHVRVTKGFKADIWFDGNPLPGATGTIQIDRNRWMGWTSAVATSTVRGWIQAPGGKKIDVTGWRGYTDHNWGKFNMFDQAQDGWEWGVVHEPDGGAKLVGGLVKRGGIWIGTAVDVKPNREPWGCSSSIMEQGDFYSGRSYFTGQTFAMPGYVRLRCAPGDIYDVDFTMKLLTPGVVDGGVLAATAEAQYFTVPGSIGMYEHVRSLLSRFDAYNAARRAKRGG